MKNNLPLKDENLIDLFNNYKPILSSDDKFIEQLQRNIESVDPIKSYSEKARKNSLLGLITGMVSGFITGVLCCLYYSDITDFIIRLTCDLFNSSRLPDFPANVFSSVIIMTLIVSVTYFTFDLVYSIHRPSSFSKVQ